MKHIFATSLALGLATTLVLATLAPAQPAPPNATEKMRAASQALAQATQEARAQIQVATDDLNAALLRGDAAGALQWLAPDFEMGQRQYRRRDLSWMKRALPLQLEKARFTELSTRVDELEWVDGKAAVGGPFEARAALKNNDNGRASRQMSGGPNALWTQTPQGWRLLNDTGAFYVLSQLVALPAPLVFPAPPDQKPHPSGLQRENPAVVLEGANGFFAFSVEALAFSPDGATLATGNNQTIRFASTQSGVPTGEIATPAYIRELAYAPDGSVFSAHNDGKVRRWDGAGHSQGSFSLGERYNVSELKLSPGGQLLAAFNRTAQLWEVPSGRKLRELPPQSVVAGFSPDDSMIAVVTSIGIEIRALRGDVLAAYAGESWGAFAADGQIITQFNGRLRFRTLGDAAVKREVEIANPFRQQSVDAATVRMNGIPVMISGFIYTPVPVLSPDGTVAVNRFVDGSVGVYEAQTGKLRRLLRGFGGNVMGGEIAAMAFSRDGRRLAIGSRNGETAIWDIGPPKP